MKILRINHVMEKTGLPTSTIYRLIQEGTFPKAIPLMKRCVGWLESEVDDWIMDKIALRENGKAV